MIQAQATEDIQLGNITSRLRRCPNQKRNEPRSVTSSLPSLLNTNGKSSAYQLRGRVLYTREESQTSAGSPNNKKLNLVPIDFAYNVPFCRFPRFLLSFPRLGGSWHEYS